MGKKIERIGVITSGGDAPGMNAAIRAVVRACAYYNIECLGAYRGYQGLIEGDFKMLSPRHVSNIINRGGTMLKSARSSEFRTKEGRAKAYKEIKKAEIDAEQLELLRLYESCHESNFDTKLELDEGPATIHNLLSVFKIASSNFHLDLLIQLSCIAVDSLDEGTAKAVLRSIEAP